MAWTYLVDTEVSPSDSLTGSEPSHTVISSDTLELFYSRGSRREIYPRPRYGTTSGPSPVTSSPNCHRSTLFSEVSRVRISAGPVKLRQVWRVSGVAYSLKLLAWSKKYTRLSSFWKTSRPLERMVWSRLSKGLPAFGMIVAGRLYLPRALERTTSAKGGSLRPAPGTFPTPTLCGGGWGWGQEDPLTGDRKMKEKPSLEYMAAKGLWPTPVASTNNWGYGWRKEDSLTGDRLDTTKIERPSLNRMAETGDWPLLPTPTASEGGTSNNGSPRDGRRTEYATKGRPSLGYMAKHGLFPTPRTSLNGNGWCKEDPLTGDKIDGAREPSLQNMAESGTTWPDSSDTAQPTGRLNPEWVEWLMGLPIGWTALEPSVTEWYQRKDEPRS